jgi:hypothetical protein
MSVDYRHAVYPRLILTKEKVMKDETAFPTCVSTDNSGGLNYGSSGITIRDYFASAALPALIANAAREVPRQEMMELATAAYKLADAMLEARNR